MTTTHAVNRPPRGASQPPSGHARLLQLPLTRVPSEHREFIASKYGDARSALARFNTDGIDDAHLAQLRAEARRLRSLQREIRQHATRERKVGQKIVNTLLAALALNRDIEVFGDDLIAVASDQLRTVSAALARKQA